MSTGGGAGRWARRLGRGAVALLVLVLAVPATVVLVFAIQARVRLGDLKAWHRLALEHEYRAGAPGAPTTFADYRRLEERLFDEVRRRVLDDEAAADHSVLGRYSRGSIPARLALDTPYNRSFELVPETIRGGALLVHGLTDSPYSVRALAEILRDQGYYVLALRMPGHGTIPAGLVDVRWRDWYEAVVLAAKEVAARAGPGRPFYVGGHSTGGALTALYCLRSLEDAALPRPTRLLLFSPAIGISKAAALTKVISGLAFLPYFEKSRWMDLLPEYDPWKYNSFPVNAAQQIYALTIELQRSVDDAAAKNLLDAMPRVLAFQSLVDSTVTTSEVVRGLLGRLPARGHELVVFDINRNEVLQELVAPSFKEDLERVRAATFPFRLSWITNRDADSVDVVAYTREAGTRDTAMTDLDLRWPRGIVSLGHVALPFPEDDPIYGLTPRRSDLPWYPLGALTIRGEAGTLVVSLEKLARLRSNPFFKVIRDRVEDAIEADRAP